MSIMPVSNTYPTVKSEQRRDAAVTGAAGALIGGSSAAIIGSLAKPDFVDFAKTADKMDNKYLQNEQKELRKIAKALEKDAKTKLSKEQKELLEYYELSGKSPKEIKITASQIGRRYHLDAMGERLDKSIEKTQKHLDTLKKYFEENIDAAKYSSAFDEEFAKTNGAKNINEYAKKHADVFRVIEDTKPAVPKFKTVEDAVKFLETRTGKLKKFQTKLDNTINRVFNIELNNSAALREIFESKKGSTFDAVMNTFRNAKAKKYAGFGALFAGIAAGLTAYSNSGKVQTIEVAKPVPVAVPVPVPVPVKGKCPECKPCEEAKHKEAPKPQTLEQEIKELKEDIKEVEKEAASEE